MPRKVLITLAPLGAGHHSVAVAVRQALAEREPGLETHFLDVFSGAVSRFPLTAIPSLYRLFTVRHPVLWRSLYALTNRPERFAAAERLAEPYLLPGLRRALDRIGPDLVLSVFPALGRTLARALRERSPALPFGVVVTDLATIHPAWVCPEARWYAVPAEEAYRACASAGLRPAALHISGLPIRREFHRPPEDRQALRRRLGVAPGLPLVLVTGGGEGAGRLRAVLAALQRASAPWTLVVVAGRNQPLTEQLRRASRDPNVRVLGYVHNLAEWMWAADVLVTKAGPTTIVEAVHCELPLVLHGALPGQEAGNIDFVTAHGIGVFAPRPADLVDAVATAAHDPETRRRMQAAMRALQRPQAAREVARLALDCA